MTIIGPGVPGGVRGPLGVPQRWDLSPEEIRRATQDLVSGVQEVYEQLGAVSLEDVSVENFLEPLAHIRLEYTASRHVLDFPQFVSPSKEVRSASAEADKILSQLDVDLSMRTDVFERLTALQSKLRDDLPPEDKRFLDRLVTLGRRKGLHLPPGVQEEINRMSKRISELCIEFNQNLNEDHRVLVFSREDLGGLAASYLSGLQRTPDGLYLVSLDAPHYYPLMKSCNQEDTRRRMETAFHSRCLQVNTPILKQLLSLRSKVAQLLGFSSHAHYVLEVNMAKTPETVSQFLDSLSSALRPLGEAERRSLLSLKRAESALRGVACDGALHSWDVPFLQSVEERGRFGVDKDLLLEFCPLEAVLEGLLGLLEDLLGLRFSRLTPANANDSTSANANVWHSDVLLFSAAERQSGDELGRFYLDLHPREGKYDHSGCFALQPGVGGVGGINGSVGGVGGINGSVRGVGGISGSAGGISGTAGGISGCAGGITGSAGGVGGSSGSARGINGFAGGVGGISGCAGGVGGISGCAGGISGSAGGVGGISRCAGGVGSISGSAGGVGGISGSAAGISGSAGGISGSAGGISGSAGGVGGISRCAGGVGSISGSAGGISGSAGGISGSAGGISGSRRLPLVALLANFSPPLAGRPALLQHHEMETLSHELGHVMHEICSKTGYSDFSGTQVEMDFVEVPSQVLENWVWETEALRRMTRHYQDGSPAPKELLDRLVQSRVANTGLMNLRQVFLSKVDQVLHSSSQLDPVQVYAQIHQDLLGVPATPGTNMLTSFSHLVGGYDSQYYGYLWSEVYSCDIFYSRFKKEGISNPEVGREFRRRILEAGGSVDGGDMLESFLGRPPRHDAFFHCKGLRRPEETSTDPPGPDPRVERV